MANLILTKQCNQKCSYCFAESYPQSDANSISFISKNSFINYLNYLERSKIDQVRLIGGEPSLHPKFSEYIKVAFEKDLKIVVFTNGLIPTIALDTMVEIPVNRIDALVNVTSNAAHDRFYLHPRQYDSLSKLGQRAHLSYTIYQPDASGLFNLLKIIEKTNCCRSVRIGLAQPYQDRNRSLSPKHYRRVAEGILQFIRSAYQSHVTVEFDCGFVRCMFKDDEIAILQQTKTHFGWRCNPIIDIQEDESAIPCFPLSDEFSIPNALSRTEIELQKQFSAETRHLRIVGIFPECSTCAVRVLEGCSGGCLAIAIQRMHQESFVYSLPVQ